MRQNFGSGGWTLIIGLVFGVVFGSLMWMATVQPDVAGVAKYYDHLPNQQRPWLLHFDWKQPDWLQITFVGLAVFCVGYLGFFTAIFVNPKHRNADIAAGLVTSLFAGFALFAVFMGPMKLYGVQNQEDLWLLQRAAFSSSDEVRQDWLERYPDMEQVHESQRAFILYQKIRGDRYARVPKAIWLGMLMSFGICLFTGLSETMAAGPLLRRHGTWYATFLPYSEQGVATAVVMFVGGIYLIGPMMWGTAGFGWWKLLSLLGPVILAIWAAVRRWHWSARTALQAVWILCFLSFMVNDFMHLPQVGRRAKDIGDAERLVEQNPENIQYKLDLGPAYSSLAEYWRRHERWKDAAAPYERAIAVYGSLYEQDLDDERKRTITNRLRQWLVELAEVYDHLQRHEDSRVLLRQFRPENSGQWRGVARLLRSHVDSMIESRSLETEQKQKYLRDFIQEGLRAGEVKVPPDKVDTLAAWIASPQRWSIIGPFPGGHNYKGLDTAHGPEQDTEPKDEYRGVDGTVKWTSVVSYPGYEVNLREIVAETDFVVAYALTYVESPQAQDVTLRVGSDDGNKIWLNDKLVTERRVYRGYREGQDRVKVRLRKGVNKLLIKVEQANAGWGFSVDAADEQGWPVPLKWQTNPD
jgi:hypothetical protein